MCVFGWMETVRDFVCYCVGERASWNLHGASRCFQLFETLKCARFCVCVWAGMCMVMKQMKHGANTGLRFKCFLNSAVVENSQEEECKQNILL